MENFPLFYQIFTMLHTRLCTENQLQKLIHKTLSTICPQPCSRILDDSGISHLYREKPISPHFIPTLSTDLDATSQQPYPEANPLFLRAIDKMSTEMRLPNNSNNRKDLKESENLIYVITEANLTSWRHGPKIPATPPPTPQSETVEITPRFA